MVRPDSGARPGVEPDPVGTVNRSATRAPHPALAGLVEDYLGYRITGGAPGLHYGLPSRALTIVLSFEEPLDMGWLGRAETRDRFWTVASGLSAVPAAIFHDGRQYGIQLGLTPAGARALLGVPAAAIATDLVRLEDLLGALAARCYESVAAACGWEARFAALDAELVRLLRAHDGQHRALRPELAEAWRWLGRHVETGTVGALATEIGWSRRHLAAQFRAEYGLRPKEVAGIARFQRARAELGQTPAPALADVAASCGYADQAHLTREWRRFAGCTPTEWRRDDFAFVQDQLAAG
jgi:AraC-like DNA-binding protein